MKKSQPKKVRMNKCPICGGELAYRVSAEVIYRISPSGRMAKTRNSIVEFDDERYIECGDCGANSESNPEVDHILRLIRSEL